MSGIWQTVWLEEVPTTHIQSLKIDTQIDPAIVSVKANVTGRTIAGQTIRVTIKNGDRVLGTARGRQIAFLTVPDAEYWSPQNPKLYDLVVELLDIKGDPIDTVKSYTGIREVGEKIGKHGNPVFTLNGEEIFHWGPLDQGWWPGGLLTPPSDEAMRFDIDYLKAAGFNMIRKHIKVEPHRYYAYCDQVGMLVWQDQVSGGSYDAWPKDWAKLNENKSVPDAEWPKWAHDQFMAELKGMVDILHNHPSIVCWVPFNERWGQHNTESVGRWIVDYDPTRHINIASGGNFFPIGDIADAHSYPDPKFPIDDPRYANYIKVVGEFGGHGYPVEGHKWKKDAGNWGYGGLPKNEEEFKQRLWKSFNLLNELRIKGLAGAVYTQTTDVETEINGLITYDRKVIKVPATEMAAESAKLLGK
ncbi:glycoside hydrolase family 2 protein [Luteolibacter algae]|uniref:Glycoside hydrolase family 2 protein n=1 Tax=Luteolibacter algae TaxID=454151 RepID=A0ABW5D7F2_9BACT